MESVHNDPRNLPVNLVKMGSLIVEILVRVLLVLLLLLVTGVKQSQLLVLSLSLKFYKKCLESKVFSLERLRPSPYP